MNKETIFCVYIIKGRNNIINSSYKNLKQLK